ncbi:GWxTD domain-containing protein [Rhodohalobacter sp. 614A]|uniref:GWxTD domain-containing protein n=1 Tax=Rhodohalobacter sp. 614A TaxID=2908649 RepID=UPI001F2AC354|nr:GWxTD domain-containing protein [Rhodohalobacter sp. 614A]
MIKRTLLFLLLLSLTVSTLYAQRTHRAGSAYQGLLMRTDRPNSYFDHVSFPTDDNQSQIAVLFRLDYDSVPFLKKSMNMKGPRPEAEYYGPVQVGFEVYEGMASRRSSDTGQSLFRDAWQDTLWVDTYEKTTSRSDYTQGFMSTTLGPGEYHYELQMIRSNMPAMADRRNSRPDREMPSPKRNFEITGYEGSDNPEFMLLKSFETDENSFSATFYNYGNNILYGQNYSILVRIPETASENAGSLSLKLYRLTGGANADSKELRHTVEISPEELIRFGEVSFTHSEDEIGFHTNISDDGALYAYAQIPNQNFENSRYRIALENSESGEVLGEKMIQSQWLDMPVSLYNLDVAINMLRFIVSDNTLDEIDSGSDTEKERKFREFWAQRDPTQDTEFNELMTEFYKRIDYAYNEFSSLQVPGFETDQGKAYILYGEPDNIERRMPTNAPTREIWVYPNKTLIFEATTGFGDFELVSEQQS